MVHDPARLGHVEKYWQELLAAAERAVGFNVKRFRQDHLLRRLSEAASRLSIDSWAGLLLAIRDTERGRAALREMLPVRHSAFFRDYPQFLEFFSLLAQLGHTAQDGNTTILSAGCAGGEEAFSIGMMCEESELFRNNWHVTGVEIIPELVSLAQTARFQIGQQGDMPGAFATKYLRTTDKKHISISPAVSTRIEFTAGDLLDANFPLTMYRVLSGGKEPASADRHPVCDGIACRYLIVFLSAQAIECMATNLSGLLREGGVLWVGVGEYIPCPVKHRLKLIRPGFYRRL